MLGSAQIRWVEVPLATGLGSPYPKVGVMPRWPGYTDKEKPKRARSRKRWTQPRRNLSCVYCRETTGGQGVHREVESEGLEEKYRAVIEGATP